MTGCYIAVARLVLAHGVTVSALTQGDLRLQGGQTDAGTLEMYREGRWGTICASKPWDSATADVACRQLGFGMSTGTLKMPLQSRDDRPIWISNVSCLGAESNILDCSFSGLNGLPSTCTHKEDLGLRCLACEGASCERYRTPVLFHGELNLSDPVTVTTNDPMHMACNRKLHKDSSIICNIPKYGDASHADFRNLMPELVHSCHGNPSNNSNFDVLLMPFHEESTQAFVYPNELAHEYKDKFQVAQEYLRTHPDEAKLLHCMFDKGIISWNSHGIRGTPLRNNIALDTSVMGLIKKLYFSPRMQVMMDLDTKESQTIDDITDPTTKHLAQTLIDDGVVDIDNYGLDIAALNATVDRAFEDVDPAVTSVTPTVVTTRVKLDALQPLIHNSTINAIVRAYLGPDATLDGYKAVRFLGSTSGKEFISALWHNDRAGNRLKLFVRLHDVDPDPKAGGHPTLVARGSHDFLPFSIEEFAHSRFTDAFVESQYSISSLGGKMGSGFIFDTNSLHRGYPEGHLSRTTLILEYHSARKCPVIQKLKLPIPCPSGDQRLASASELKPADGSCDTKQVVSDL